MQPVTLSDGRENERGFGHGERRPDANARAAAERNIRKARPLGGALGRETLRIETVWIFPERRLAVQQPRYNQHLGARRNALAQDFIGGDRDRDMVCAGG